MLQSVQVICLATNSLTFLKNHPSLFHSPLSYIHLSLLLEVDRERLLFSSLPQDACGAIVECLGLDIVSTLNASALHLDDDTLRRLRADSVKHVKQTNGRLSFEQRVKNEEDAWQD